MRHGDFWVFEKGDRKAELSGDIRIGADPNLGFSRSGGPLAIHGDDDGDFAHVFAFRVFRGRTPTLSRWQTI